MGITFKRTNIITIVLNWGYLINKWWRIGRICYKGKLKFIEVFDATGKKVSSFTEQNQINVGNLPEGLYFISATNKLNQKLNGKFIISKN